MSVANLLEAVILVEGRGGPAARHELDVLLERAGVEFVPVTSAHASAAPQAWRRFGKGNHPAALNYGDCFAYAPSKSTGEPLLRLQSAEFFVGEVLRQECEWLMLTGPRR